MHFVEKENGIETNHSKLSIHSRAKCSDDGSTASRAGNIGRLRNKKTNPQKEGNELLVLAVFQWLQTA